MPGSGNLDARRDAAPSDVFVRRVAAVQNWRLLRQIGRRQSQLYDEGHA